MASDDQQDETPGERGSSEAARPSVPAPETGRHLVTGPHRKPQQLAPSRPPGVAALTARPRMLDEDGRPYRRRRPRPILTLLAVGAVFAAGVWVVATVHQPTDSTAIDCNRPVLPTNLPADTKAPPLGQRADRAQMADVAPVAPAATAVRVLNANGQSGQATAVSEQLSELGFGRAAVNPVGNDAVYPGLDLHCHGQIRFGDAGEAAASTLWIVAPCTELIRDERTDPTVDLALGDYFGTLSPGADAMEVLRALRESSSTGKTPPLDPTLVAAARNAKC